MYSGYKALAHYKDFHNDFRKKNCFENRWLNIKLLTKLLHLQQKLVLCMNRAFTTLDYAI